MILVMIWKIAVRTDAEGIICGSIRKWMDGGVEDKEELCNNAIVKEVYEDSSKAQVMEEEKATEIREGYRVRTR